MGIIDSYELLMTPNAARNSPDFYAPMVMSLRKNLFGNPESESQPTKAQETTKQIKHENYFLRGTPVEDFLAAMDEAGIARTVVVAPSLGFRGRIPTDGALEAVERFPDRFLLGPYGVNPYQGMDAVREFEVAVKSKGFRALHLFPHWIG